MSRGSGDHYRKHAKAPVTKHRPGIFGRILTERSRELPFGSTRVLHPWAAWPGALRPKFGPIRQYRTSPAYQKLPGLSCSCAWWCWPSSLGSTTSWLWCVLSERSLCQHNLPLQIVLEFDENPNPSLQISAAQTVSTATAPLRQVAGEPAPASHHALSASLAVASPASLIFG